MPDNRSLARALAQQQSVDPDLVEAVIGRESGWNPSATSRAGARGLMQLMPETAEALGVTDIEDPTQNLTGGIKYLKQQLARFGGNKELALAAYNAGPGAVQKAGNTIPPFPETQAYVKDVMGRYAQLTGGTPPSSTDQQGAAENRLYQTMAAKDPRNPIIEEGLRIKGVDRAAFGGAFDDPNFTSEFYNATMAMAQDKNPQLRLGAGIGGYLDTLKQIPTMGKAKGPEPIATVTTPEGARDAQKAWYERVGDDIAETATHYKANFLGAITRGATTKPIEDMMAAQESLTKNFKQSARGVATQPWEAMVDPGRYTMTGNENLENQLQGAKTISEAIDNIVAQPKTGTNAVVQSLASFLSPFNMIVKGVGTATEALGATSRVVQGAAAGTGVNMAYFDPDAPIMLEHIDALARLINPKNPAAVQGDFQKYIAGETDPTTFRTKFLRFFGTGVEGGLTGALVETALSAFNQLRAWKAAKRTMPTETPPEAPTTQEAMQTATGRMEQQQLARQQGEQAKTEGTVAAKDIAQEKAESLVASQQYNARVAQRRAVMTARDQSALKPLELEPSDPMHNRDSLTEAAARQEVADELAAQDRLRARTQEIKARQATPEATPGAAAPSEDVNAASREYLAQRQAERDARVQARSEEQQAADIVQAAPEEDIVSRKGTPFRTKANAETAIAGRGDVSQETHEAVETADGWVVRRKGTTPIAAETAPAPETPPPTTEPQTFIRKEGIPFASEKEANAVLTKWDKVAPDTHEVVQVSGGWGIRAKGQGAEITPPVGATSPEAAQAAITQQVEQARQAGEMPQGMQKWFGRLLDDVSPDDATKATMLGMATKALVGGTLGEGAVSTVEAATGNETTSPEARLGRFLTFAALAMGGPKLVIRLAQALEKSGAFENLPTSAVRDLAPLAPDTRPRGFGVPAVVRAEPGTPGMIAAAPGINIRTNLRNITTPSDLADFVRDIKTMVPTSGPVRDKVNQSVITNLDNTGRRLGEEPAFLAKELQNSPNANDFVDKVVALTTGGRLAAEEAIQLSQAYLNGHQELQQALLHRFGLASEFARGLRSTDEDFGKMLTAFRAGPDGKLSTLSFEGDTTGMILPARMGVDELAQWISASTPEQVLKMARRAATPSWTRSLDSIIMSSYLMGIHTPVKVLLEKTVRQPLEMLDRLNGAWSNPMFDKAFGTATDVQVEDVVRMAQSWRDGLVTSLKLAGQTAATGETRYVEAGTGMLGSQAGGLSRQSLGIPQGWTSAGAMADYVGSQMEQLSSRLLTADAENSQFLIEQMEMSYQASRYARSQGTRFASPAEWQDYLQRFPDFAPPEILSEVKYQKKALDFMNALTDPRGGFQALRQVTAAIQTGASGIPLVRATQMPFLRAMTNVLTQALEHVPLVNALDVQYSAADGLSWNFLNELRSDNPMVATIARGKLLTSMQLGATAVGLGAAGILRGETTRPGDRQTAQLLTDAGRPPMSISLPTEMAGLKTLNLPIDPNGFIGTVLLPFAQIGAQASGQMTPAELNAYQSLLAWGEHLLKDRTAMGIIAKVLDGVTSGVDTQLRDLPPPERKGDFAWIGKTADNLLIEPWFPPAAVKSTIQSSQPYKVAVDGFLDRIAARWTGGGENKVLTDQFGRPVRWGGGVGPDVWDQATQYIQGMPDGQQPMDELAQRLVEKGVHIHDVGGVASRAGFSVPLNEEEKQLMREFVANGPTDIRTGDKYPTLHDALMQTTGTDTYKNAPGIPDGIPTMLVRQVLRQYHALAREMLFDPQHNPKAGELDKAIQARAQQLTGVTIPGAQ